MIVFGIAKGRSGAAIGAAGGSFFRTHCRPGLRVLGASTHRNGLGKHRQCPINS
jgi:hypothetical protein